MAFKQKSRAYEEIVQSAFETNQDLQDVKFRDAEMQTFHIFVDEKLLVNTANELRFVGLSPDATPAEIEVVFSGLRAEEARGTLLTMIEARFRALDHKTAALKIRGTVSSRKVKSDDQLIVVHRIDVARAEWEMDGAKGVIGWIPKVRK